MLDGLHTQANAPLLVDFEHFHSHTVAFFELVTDILDPLLRDLRDMYQPVLARQNRDKGAEVHQLRNLAIVNHAHFHIGGELFDTTPSFLGSGVVNRPNGDGAIIRNVDGRVGFFANRPYGCATFADNVTNPVGVDFHRYDPWRVFRELRAWLRNHGVHCL